MTDENWQIVLVSFCEALGVRARPRAAFGSQHRNVQKAMRRRIALQLRKLSRVQHCVRNSRDASMFVQPGSYRVKC